MHKLTFLNILLDVLERPAVMIIENVNHAVLVEEFEFNKVIVLVSIDVVTGCSIPAVLTLFKGLSK